MIHYYAQDAGVLHATAGQAGAANPPGTLWIDLMDPEPAEAGFIDQAQGGAEQEGDLGDPDLCLAQVERLVLSQGLRSPSRVSASAMWALRDLRSNRQSSRPCWPFMCFCG